MPYGIPPTDPRKVATDEYCDATQVELVGIISDIVGPINSHIELIDSTLSQILLRLKTLVGRQFGSLDRDFVSIQEDLSSFVNTSSSWYSVQLNQLQQLMDFGTQVIPPEDQEEFQFINVEGDESESSTTNNQTTNETTNVAGSQTNTQTTTTTQTATQSPSNVTAVGGSAVSTATGGYASASAQQPGSQPSAELPITMRVEAAVPAPPPTAEQVRIEREKLLALQTLLAVEGKPTDKREGFSKLTIPEPPKQIGILPCPKAPPLVAGLGAAWGSEEWCESVEQILGWLEMVGKELGKFLEDSIKPTQWELWVRKWDVPSDWPDWLKTIALTIREFIATAVGLAGKTVGTIIDIVRCSWYYVRVTTPTKRPEATLSIIILRSLLDSVEETRIGSQSYLGFTLGFRVALQELRRFLDAMETYIAPTEIPSLAEVQDAWLRGTIASRQQVECLMRLNGRRPELEWKFFDARMERLTVEEALEYARRKGLDETRQAEILRPLGFTDERIAAARVELYDKFPSISEHLHFLQRNVHDDEYVKDYGLIEGFEERFWKKFGNQLRALGMTKEIACLHYAAHWLQPSPTEMHEFVYRLHPDFVGPELAFTDKDFERVLAEKDVPPFMAKRFRAVLYKVPALTYLRDMHRMDLLKDEDMAKYHRKLGYDPKDSELFTQVDTLRKRRMRATQASGWNPPALRRAFIVGQITEAFVREKMEYLGFLPQDSTDLIDRAKAEFQYRALSRSLSTQLNVTTNNVRQALTVGVMSVDEAVGVLTKLGWDENRSRGIAETQLAMGKVQRVRQTVNRLRRAFLSGEINEDFAKESMSHLGLTDDAIASYIYQWDISNTPSRKRRTAAQTVTDMARGWISKEEAVVKWHNLGYDEQDIRLFLLDAREKEGKYSGKKKEEEEANES